MVPVHLDQLHQEIVVGSSPRTQHFDLALRRGKSLNRSNNLDVLDNLLSQKVVIGGQNVFFGGFLEVEEESLKQMSAFLPFQGNLPQTNPVLFEFLEYLLVETPLPPQAPALVEILVQEDLGEQIEDQVAEVDIPALILASDVGYSSEVDEYVSLKELISKGSQGGSFSSPHHVQLPEVPNHVDSEVGSQEGQVGGLNGDSVFGVVEDGVTMDRYKVYVFELKVIHKVQNEVRKVLGIVQFFLFEGQKSSLGVLHDIDRVENGGSVGVGLGSLEVVGPFLVPIEETAGQINSIQGGT